MVGLGLKVPSHCEAAVVKRVGRGEDLIGIRIARAVLRPLSQFRSRRALASASPPVSGRLAEPVGSLQSLTREAAATIIANGEQAGWTRSGSVSDAGRPVRSGR